jgi:hypothetical protein
LSISIKRLHNLRIGGHMQEDVFRASLISLLVKPVLGN